MLIGAVALLLGVAIGYYLRVIIALGQKRSIEIDIKQMMVGAKEEAQKRRRSKEKVRVEIGRNKRRRKEERTRI